MDREVVGACGDECTCRIQASLVEYLMYSDSEEGRKGLEEGEVVFQIEGSWWWGCHCFGGMEVQSVMSKTTIEK